MITPSSSQSIEFLQDNDLAQQFLESTVQEPLIALDTEAASFHRYHDRVYLLQFSTRERTAVIDPLLVTQLEILGRRLADPGTEVVFHDADYDLRMLDRDYGFRARNIFDTRIAAQLINEPGIGLAALLEKYVGITLDKRFQRADWSRRPLLPGMLEYAAMDTRHLPQLRDIMLEKLTQMNRLAWAREEFAKLEEVRWTPSVTEEGFWKIKGAKQLRGPAITILRELHLWRDQVARQLDRAPFRVLNNETLIELANARPRTPVALKTVRGISSEVVQRRGTDILAGVERGLAVPASEIPRPERGPRIRPDPEYLERVERLKLVRNAEAIRVDLPPGVLCPNGTLEAVARVEPKTIEELTQVAALRRWQGEVIGAALVEAARPPA
ncbi:MAG: ribonuclease D [Gemmatimonadota bacterium]